MGKKSVDRKNRSFILGALKFIGNVLWTIVKIPTYILNVLFWMFDKVLNLLRISSIKNNRERMNAKYEKFEVIQKVNGKFDDWEKFLETSDSSIGIIVGARGSGKSAVGLKILENIHSKNKEKIYAMGFKSEEMPSWIECISDVSSITNDSFVLVDEGGVLFNSRDAMKGANKLLSELIFISRHKNLSILFISQNSANLEVNILRQADYLILKHSSLLQKDFERKIVQKLYEQTAGGFEKYSSNKGLSYIHSAQFDGFVTNTLPSFWKQSISKSFSGTRVK